MGLVQMGLEEYFPAFFFVVVRHSSFSFFIIFILSLFSSLVAAPVRVSDRAILSL